MYDMRLPDMLHGRVIRPPYAGLDSGEFVGNSLLEVDESSIAQEGLRASSSGGDPRLRGRGRPA